MPLETRDRDPRWGRMFMSSAELEALREAAAARVRSAYDATTRAIAGGMHHLAGERDAPVDKFKTGVSAEMQGTNSVVPRLDPKATPSEPAQPPVDDARLLLDLIAQAEVKGHPVSYDVTFGFGKFDPAGFDRPITQMTLDEIDAFQVGLKARAGSTPVGKYQINRATLQGLRRNLSLAGSEVFTPELQERLGRELLREARYDAYLAGEVSDEVFRARLNKMWASVPLPEDRSAHDQPLGTTDAEVRAALARIKAGRTAPGRR